jgi:hypothetical protein
MSSSSACPLYVALKLFIEPVECKRIHEPIEGWSWVCCESVEALLRDLIRAVKCGFDPIIASVQGPIDILRVEELENQTIRGCFKIHAMPDKYPELLKLTSSIKVKVRPTIIVACFENTSINELIQHEIIPLVWDQQSNT